MGLLPRRLVHASDVVPGARLEKLRLCEADTRHLQKGQRAA